MAFFQVPSSFKSSTSLLLKARIALHLDYYIQLPFYWVKLKKEKPMKMHLNTMEMERVLELLLDENCHPCAVYKDNSLSAHNSWVYIVQKIVG